jgi:hypothetical protein
VKIADLTTGTAKIASSYKTMRVHWDATKDEWHDANQRHFEERFLNPLEPQLNSALEAISRLAEILSRAERECE